MGTPSTGQRGLVTSVMPLFAALALLMVGNGLIGSLLGVRADLEGFPTMVIGVVMTMYYAGFLVGSLTIPRWLVVVGHIRVFAGLSALAAAAALSYTLAVTPVTWGALRLVAGLCMSGLYVTVESWLNDRASNETRGRLLSVYMLVVSFGLGFGQLLLGLTSPLDPTLFILAGILISLAVVPITMMQIPTPGQIIPVDFSLRALVRSAPLGVLAVSVAGATGSTILALGAVYASKIGMEPGFIGVFLAASLVGGAVTQYPLGAMSDHFPRRRVILAVAALAAAVAIVGVAVDRNGAWLFVIAATFGGLVFPLYSLAVSYVNDVMPAQQLVRAAAGIVFVYGVGSVAGPLAVSVLMAMLGPVGYFWGLALLLLPLVVFALVRIIFRTRPKQRAFLNLPPRSSTAAALLADPGEDG
jgi:MFS family permease